MELANGSSVSTSTVVKLVIDTRDITTTLENVYYVPGVNSIILSCSLIDKYGVTIIPEKKVQATES